MNGSLTTIGSRQRRHRSCCRWLRFYYYFYVLLFICLFLWLLSCCVIVYATLCDTVCQWLATGRWYSPISSTNRTDRHDITEISIGVRHHNRNPEILLKVALNTTKQTYQIGEIETCYVLLELLRYHNFPHICIANIAAV
jgi:hypothetical protein